jgi:deazaflavin-dependent oxidoreductase (nitroreductase family)
MSGMHDFNRTIIDEFRANAGKVSGQFEGAPLLLLHTTGKRTGEERINPMMFKDLGADIAVFASKGGAPTSPDWFYNLVAQPRATVEVGTDTYDVVARVAEGQERDQIWEPWKKAFPGFAEYEAATTRTIPVVILSRV